ncbi:Serine/threonine-protein kinase Nek8 [Paramyrothecium foliicola]|nr:Serine/threonine-protein kinase Nek8 [Paramyrothecium foliicola]
MPLTHSPNTAILDCFVCFTHNELLISQAYFVLPLYADDMVCLSLSQNLEEGLTKSSLEDKPFVSLDFLERGINEENIKKELGLPEHSWLNMVGLAKPSSLPFQVAHGSKKIFAALVMMDRAKAISDLLDEGLRDEHLPLSISPDHEALLCCNGKVMFPFGGWKKVSVNDFVRDKQWLFLAPVLDVKGRLIKLNPDCPLPFVKSEVVDHGAAGIVHKAEIHPAHQQGFDMETVNLQVAVKHYLHRDDFVKENDILQQIKDLNHSHIIRHFASIDKGKHTYIVLPWADGGNLQDFWEAEPQTSQDRVLWSLRQMLGLTEALHLLHDRFKCRHGDLKPGNILCVGEGGQTTLKIADFGVSRIHHAQTMYRKSATISNLLTPSYQGPEVEFENVNQTDQRPRSRKYDIWSLGCVFLEFTLWLLHGPRGIESFGLARGRGTSSTDTSRPLYEVTDKARRAAKVHKLVSSTIESLQADTRCEGDTALAALLRLIKDQMLQPDVNDRPWADEVGRQLRAIVRKAEREPSYIFHPCQTGNVYSLDFASFL